MMTDEDGPRSIGKYRLDEVLGKGAMGVVYRATDPLIERTVALKTVRCDVGDAEQARDMIERFRKEAQAAGRLTHPNIVTVYEYGESDGVAFIAMEFVAGTPLSALLGEQPCATGRVLGWMTDLLDALDYSHARGVVHRDIKPANLLVTPQGRIKVSDFGIARIESSTLTLSGAMLGTPSYMSPEQFRGEAIDGRSDLFSAAIVLYQLLTGRRPFAGSTATVMQQVLTHTPPEPSTVNSALPRAFDAVVMRALDKDPAARFPTAWALLQALQDAHASAPAADQEPDDSDATVLVRPPPRPMAPQAGWSATAARSRHGIGTAALPAWAQPVLPQLETVLTQQIGPMARLLLRKIAATAPDFDTLGEQLLEQIPSPAARARFEQDLAQIRGTLAPATLTGTGGQPSLAAPVPTPEFAAALVPLLAIAIGPIASIVVKRALPNADSRAALVALVAEHIEAPAARARFVEQAGALDQPG